VAKENPQTTDWPTKLRSRFADGRCIGVDGSVWLYRSVPLAPVVDAVSPNVGLDAAAPLMSAFEVMSNLAQVRIARRSASKSSYRQVHILLVNVPKRFTPPAGELGVYLAGGFGDAEVDRRLLLFGVRLRDRMGGRAAPAELQGPGLRRAVGRTGYQLNRAVGSVAQTLSTGTTPLEDFDVDFMALDEALARAGLRVPSTEEFRLANAWWNRGGSPDTVFLEHIDHLHTFTSASSAMAAARLGADGDDCANWPPMGNTHSLAFGCVADFELPFVAGSDPAAHWAADLLDAGAVCVSIRGLIEPAKVTRHELRRRKKQYIDDIRERADQGKMERAEQEETLAELSEVEAVYSMAAAPPTVIDCSVMAVFSGRHEVSGYDLSDVCRDSGVVLNSMVSRQRHALAETMLCSSVRAVPDLHDLPAQTIACSGLPSLSVVGDPDGALVGFTERDRQPAWLSSTAAASEDQLPMTVVAGATGSGKALALDTRIPTPEGWTTMGDIRVGDQVFGRDGKPCTVTFVSEVNLRPDLYRVEVSDGQILFADADHQWVVSEVVARAQPRTPHRIASLANWKAAERIAESLEVLADRVSGEMTYRELHDLLTRELPHHPWKDPRSVFLALLRERCPSRKEERRVEYLVQRNPHARRWAIRRTMSRQVAIYPADVALKTLAARLRKVKGIRPREAAKEEVLTTTEMLRRGVKHRWMGARFAIRVANPLDPAHQELPAHPYLLGLWLGDGTVGRNEIAVGHADVDETLSLIHQEWPRTTTSVDKNGVYMVRLVKPHPELCGWGHRSEERNERGNCVPCRRARDAERRGSADRGKRSAGRWNESFASKLRTAGVLNGKHIPFTYLRASFEQRLQLLQGLMDTDGSITANGYCELSLCDATLAHDALELIRSLGIKATVRSAQATKSTHDETGRRLLRVTGTRWRVCFNTTLPIFRMPRKAVLVPEKVGEKRQWLYITRIAPADPAPARCVQVDSSDATYLVGDFVPTHNTVLMLHLADQFARIRTIKGERTPCVILDPKQGSDHSPAVRASGGQVVSLDELISADGVFDPLRFANSRGVGVEIASSMLISVNPWGDQQLNYETPLIRALSYGVERDATCIGQALTIARNEGVAPEAMVDAVFGLADASPMFRACVGIEPQSTALRIAQGVTLIKVGDAHLDLPQPGSAGAAPLQQRVALAIVRMMVFGSAMALASRRGVLLIDEAWVVLSAGRQEVERLGRLARSQTVYPMLFTQRVTDATEAGLAGYISRGLILPITDPDEAMAACELFKLEPTAERLKRITAKAAIGGTTAEDLGAPNWGSMRALRDPVTREVRRGAVGIYADLSGRAVPVEVKIPDDFLAKASTNPDDIRAREEGAGEAGFPAVEEVTVGLVATAATSHVARCVPADPGAGFRR
jgi:hypothetical protein